MHAITDVTGFGILGHAPEVARGSNMQISLRVGDIRPSFPCGRADTAQFRHRGIHHNRASYSDEIELPGGLPAWRRHVLTDPQTSGGVLVSCSAERASDQVQKIVAAGYPADRIIGSVAASKPGLRAVD